MLNNSPNATCTLSPSGSNVTVPVCEKRTVCYEFDTSATSDSLALPYAVAIDGKVLPEYSKKPKALNKTTRKILLSVDSGATVTLYLNSDAHPAYRTQPVYAVRVSERDVLVLITEKKGRISHERAEVGYPYAAERAGRKLDLYRAVLTGDIWMQISHLYTEDEARNMLPPNIDPTIQQAVLSIYRGLAKPELSLSLPATSALPSRTLRVTFEEQMSVLANTSYCPLLRGILPRTHPRAMAAMLLAAQNTGMTKLRVTSCWRTSLGSIAHRAGLGLDVAYIENATGSLTVKRASLKKFTSGQNLSAEERQLYVEYENAKAEAQVKSDELGKLRSQRMKVRRPDSDLDRKIELAQTQLEVAETHRNRRLEAWEAVLKSEQPPTIRSFRAYLSQSELVQQLFDPWYMDVNTADGVVGKPNEYLSTNETIHGDHLHITIREPGLS